MAELIKRTVILCLALSGALASVGAALGQSRDTSDASGRSEANPLGGQRLVVVPYLFGHTRADAEASLRRAGLTPKFAGPSAETATVINQSIAAGRDVAAGVTVVVRMGAAQAASIAPQLLGLNRAAATARAEASGLKPIFYGPTDPGVLVASQSLAAGQQVATGTYIQLQMRAPQRVAGQPVAVASGGTLRSSAASVRTPNFFKTTRATAEARAKTAGLVLDESGDKTDRALVTRQTPRAGVLVAPKFHVRVVLTGENVPPPPAVASATVPDLTKLTQADAEQQIKNVGLVLDVSGDTGSSSLVESQTPAAGESVPLGSHVQALMAAPPAPLSAPPSPPAAVVVPAPPPAPLATPAAEAKPPADHERGGLPLVAILGGAGAALAAGAAALILRRRSKPRIDEAEPMPPPPAKPRPIVAEPAPAPPPRSPPVVDRAAPNPVEHPQALVTYTATTDFGHPTVRLLSEPPANARPLSLADGRGGADR